MKTNLDADEQQRKKNSHCIMHINAQIEMMNVKIRKNIFATTKKRREQTYHVIYQGSEIKHGITL